MKILNIVTMFLVIGIIFGFVSCEGTLLPIKGNGNLITSERTVSSFEKINISGSAEVRFHVSQEPRIVVTVDSNLDEHTRIITRGNTLDIGTENGNYSFTKYLVDVYYPILTGVSVSGSGNFSSNDSVIVSAFDSNVSGSGKIDGKIECEIFSAKISGSGKINIAGNGNNSNITISGSGDFNGNNFIINNAIVIISGSGTANISVSENLNANISGSGDINYRGDPKIDSKISGSGKIRKL